LSPKSYTISIKLAPITAWHFSSSAKKPSLNYKISSFKSIKNSQKKTTSPGSNIFCNHKTAISLLICYWTTLKWSKNRLLLTWKDFRTIFQSQWRKSTLPSGSRQTSEKFWNKFLRVTGSKLLRRYLSWKEKMREGFWKYWKLCNFITQQRKSMWKCFKWF
jgi:hypothetical protein